MGFKRMKNGARICPNCGLALDPGEKCDCESSSKSEKSSVANDVCDWCGATLIGPRFDISIGKERSSVCFRCNLAVLNTRSQRKEISRRPQW